MRWVFSGDVPDEREGTFQPSEIELAKSEAVTQESLGRSPIGANLRGAIRIAAGGWRNQSRRTSRK
jgi:hypothetical protein